MIKQSITNNHRSLPTYPIEGTDFIVDVEAGELREANNPENTISFSDLTDKGTHYEMLYDLRDKNWPPGVGPMDDQMITINIPLIAELDPEGMAVKYGKPEQYLQGRTEQEFLTGLRLLAERKEGVLPRFMIGITQFTFDLEHHLLIHEDDPRSNIYLGELWVSEDRQYDECFYHPGLERLMPRGIKLEMLPEGTFLLGVPAGFRLDPVGAAKHFAQDEAEMLRKYPLQQTYFARITKLEDISEYTRQLNLLHQKSSEELKRKKQGKRLRF